MPRLLFAAADPRPERWTELFERELAGDVEVIAWRNDGRVHDADYVVVWRPPSALFERERRLKAIFNMGAGVDGLIDQPGLPPGVPVIRLEDAGMSAQMAEFVIHQVVEHTRGMGLYRRQQRDGLWRAQRPVEREGWPVGVLGLGSIGLRVARSLASLDYPVAGWVRTPREVSGIDVHAGASGLAPFLARTRIVINTLPLTAETRDVMDAAFFAALLPGAVVINVGRGEHLVDEDLVRAVAAGQVAAATLDVFRAEPLPPDHPFWRMPEITLTPHVAARTLREETVRQIVAKIRALEAGEAVSGVVDPGRGY
ncbi:2-hydroxyacid dehydrogenase [Novispirillum sp. DQ9]|uniref:2-hydroxyacid dehydrogenase n=1 Tax=Novispirillum sp. DQ9 TaxID=3398612 RepID=UPI003C7ED83C